MAVIRLEKLLFVLFVKIHVRFQSVPDNFQLKSFLMEK